MSTWIEPSYLLSAVNADCASMVKVIHGGVSIIQTSAFCDAGPVALLAISAPNLHSREQTGAYETVTKSRRDRFEQLRFLVFSMNGCDTEQA